MALETDEINFLFGTLDALGNDLDVETMSKIDAPMLALNSMSRPS